MHRTTTILAICAAALAAVTPALAREPTQPPTTVSVTPQTLTIERTSRATLNITNLWATPVTFRARIDAKQWLRASPSQATLAPYASRTITVSSDMPRNALPRSSRAVVVLTTTQPSPAPVTVASTITVNVLVLSSRRTPRNSTAQ
jgi:hypothetical protein